jgi:hypothetical protein
MNDFALLNTGPLILRALECTDVPSLDRLQQSLKTEVRENTVGVRPLNTFDFLETFHNL